MYVALYDKTYKHIGNITDVKFDIVQRVYDFDSSSFSGIGERDFSEAFIFSFCEETGVQKYSGLVKNLSQQNNKITFKGEDLRILFDTDIILDFSNATSSDFILRTMMIIVSDALEIAHTEGNFNFDFDFTELTNEDVMFFGNYKGQYLIINAYKFIKPYIAYYNFYLKAEFDFIAKKVNFIFRTTDDVYDIKSLDFDFEIKTTDVKTNKTIATLKFDSIISENHEWVGCTEDYYERQLPENKEEQGPQTFPEPLEPPNDYEIGFVVRVEYWESGSFVSYNYYECDFNYTSRPSTLPWKKYFLGLDNKIYENSITDEKMILPIKQKIFEAEYLSEAQFSAINELVNSRYNENIIFTSEDKKQPINLEDVELMTMCNVYSSKGHLPAPAWEQIIGMHPLMLLEGIEIPYNFINVRITYQGLTGGELAEKTIIFNNTAQITQCEYNDESTLTRISGIIDFLIITPDVIVTDITDTTIINGVPTTGIWEPVILKLEVFIQGPMPEPIIKTLPVTEIEWNNDEKKIKLGFKKTLFTEVIKSERN